MNVALLILQGFLCLACLNFLVLRLRQKADFAWYWGVLFAWNLGFFVLGLSALN